MEQQTNAWYKWRQNGLSASDTPAMLNESDFTSPHELWLRKTNRIPEQTTNFAMRRGNEAESTIRALYELTKDVEAPPLLVEWEYSRIFRASLDGYDEKNNVIVEIKYPSKKKHEMALNGEVPKTYISQIQHQLMVTGAEYCDYCSYDGKKIAIVKVLPDLEKMRQIYKVGMQFWERVKSDKPWHGWEQKEVMNE